MADNRSFLANQKARNAIVGAENLLNHDSLHLARKYARIFVLGHWSVPRSEQIIPGFTLRAKLVSSKHSTQVHLKTSSRT